METSGANAVGAGVGAGVAVPPLTMMVAISATDQVLTVVENRIPRSARVGKKKGNSINGPQNKVYSAAAADRECECEWSDRGCECEWSGGGSSGGFLWE